MIKKIIRRVFNPAPHTTHVKSIHQKQIIVKKTLKSATEPIHYTLKQHGIEANLLSRAALEVCDGLHSVGFEAYVVGGAVRDMLLAREPKDFDIATNATPEQIIKAFRRAKIIGKRFKIVHVMVGRELIEVTTFRADKEGDEKTDAHGRVLADNTYGTLATDAARRDLTVNALYYNPENAEVIDFHGGMEDLKYRQLRMIGDPATRYREDPVRMLRVARFAAKLDFTIHPNSFKPILELKSLINNCPASRLFDEVQKLFMSGYAVRTLNTLRTLNLSQGLLAVMDMMLAHPDADTFIYLALDNTDHRVNTGQSTTPAFLFACLLWHDVLKKTNDLVQGNEKSFNEKSFLAREQAITTVINQQCETLAIPRRYTIDICDIWGMQIRFEQVSKRNLSILTQPRFRAAYDFFLLRCDAGEQPVALGALWTHMHLAESREEANELLDIYLGQLPESTAAIKNIVKSKKRRYKKNNINNILNTECTNESLISPK